MKNICLLFLILFVINKSTKAQSLPSGTAGIVYTYDAAGNRTKMEYVVNNSSSAVMATSKTDTAAIAKKIDEQIIKVDALYPNPTTGQITVRLVKPLQNGHVQIMDIAGRIVINVTANGSNLSYDLSRYAAGVYFLYIEQGEQKITMKIIKR